MDTKFYSRKKIGSLFRNRIDLIGSNFKLNLQGSGKDIDYKVEAKNYYGLP